MHFISEDIEKEEDGEREKKCTFSKFKELFCSGTDGSLIFSHYKWHSPQIICFFFSFFFAFRHSTDKRIRKGNLRKNKILHFVPFLFKDFIKY